MSEHYWTNFWVEHGESSSEQNPQSRVFRTLNKKPITEENWKETLEFISEKMALESNHRMLDLCGGNGLIAKALAEQCQDVVVVDISDGLLKAIGERTPNVKAIQGDMREVSFDDQSFDRVLCYAALQYLTLPESVDLFKRIYGWLKPGGKLFLGDIPDAGRQWEFFNSAERRSAYFGKLAAGEQIVGTWFDKTWLTHLAEHTGFVGSEITDQPENQIYSWFRFDMACQK